MHRLNIQLFGGPVLSGSEGPVGLSPAQAALLGIVAGSGTRGMARSQIRALLWPREEGARVAHRLAQLQYSLNRRAGGPLVLADGEFLRLDHRRAASDLAAFETSLASGERLPEAQDALERGFLIDLQRDAGDHLLDWISARGLTLQADLRREVAAQWASCQDSGDWARATVLADVLLRIDPEDETALQRLLRSRAMSGGVQEAETVYRSFRERLLAGGVPWTPSRTTVELLDRIRTMEPLAWIGAGPPGAPGVDAPLTGRDRELKLLEDALRAPLPDELDAVIVSGEAGTGKTRLLQEALAGAPLGGVRVLRGHSGELERDIPLNPLLEALTPEWVGEAIRDLDEPWQTVLLGLLPHFHLGPGPVPELPLIRPGAVPRRLFEAIRILLESLSRSRPLVLVLDDFQWADDTTVTVLEYIRRRWREGGVRVVLSVRPEALYDRPVVSALLNEIRSKPPGTEVTIGDLCEEDAILLVERVADRPLDVEERGQVCSLAGSNPFFLIELTLERLSGRLPSYPPPLDDLLPIPMSIRQIFERRLASLSSGARRCADLLAVHDLPLELRTLRQLARLSRAGAIRALEQLQELRLTAWTPEGVALRHAIVVQTVYTALSPPRRRWLHGRVAGSLLARDPSAVDRLALHFDRAGIRPQALRFAHEAADRAEHAGAVAEALRYLAIARRYTTKPPEVATILGRIAHLHYLHRDFGEAAPLLDLAAARFRELGRIADSLRARIERIDALSQREALPIEDFLDELERVKDEARDNELWEELARALDVEVHLLDRNGLVDRIPSVLAAAGDFPSRATVTARALAGAVLAYHQSYGDPETALVSSSTASALAETTPSRDVILKCLNRELGVLIHHGRVNSHRGRLLLARARELAKLTGDLGLRFHVTLNEGVWYLDTGELDRAEHCFAAAATIIQRTTPDTTHVALLFNRGELSLTRYDYEAASIHFSELVDHHPASLAWHALATAHAGLGLVDLAFGSIAGARARSDAVAALIAGRPLTANDPSLIALLEVRLGVKLRRYDQAIAQLRRYQEMTHRHKVLAWLKLKLEEVRILRRVDPRGARRAANEGLGRASELGLAIREQQFREALEP
jgi:DNA-binding SARP family transcriptional activator/tetratricopeptide (TPR) repeat protein